MDESCLAEVTVLWTHGVCGTACTDCAEGQIISREA